MAGEPKAKVIPLHANSGRGAAARRSASQRADSASRHPSVLSDPKGRASAEQIASVVREIDQRRGPSSGTGFDAPPPNELAQRIAAIAEFVRKRMTGEYTVDEFGFDPHLNDAIFLPLLRVLFNSWFRVEVSGIENLPETGAALVVANHAGVLPFDGLMTQVAVRDEHPAHRDLRLLAADIVFDMPMVGQAARKAGHTMACTDDAHRLLAAGELTAVFPEGYKGLGKHFKDRYKLQRFGRGGFVSAALRTKAPIVPCSIVGSEEIYPMIADVKLLARLLGLPYFPVTPLFPAAGPLGVVPLPSKWYIQFGEPIDTTDYDESAAEDPMVTFDLTDQVRETIQQTLYQLLANRRNTFFG
ncbi:MULTISPECIES: lysophospholipid acyltransferase family protein [Mycolicibacterium]|uniref:1-acyl-sn-glycerol-3-phosphate acyltransferase n=3 Tax=Mycolicibacterium gilvum TaxID=1804 RepID=E6TBV8_MYCSR|nr:MULTISPECIES: lysophospholipid acyltransferase family protein [Mycolicibacterium]ABP42567.1 phospholipid/glycerol acyltransferase [Mycolicibacterium gilvum PYR-GCK]ADT97415.1 1-acyl-sn-glycerol-3-phosphate acyltransferase [Mycolicibacterium gilvum Spyr1]MBV5245137.1 acyltransferase family protein [Mycolicibacterium sp. PAM1]MCV7056184.1 acyltransferase family protein [Mycolicibacterium gilvum]STZ41606.1 phospholipid/glycerol acyltransferase [Mycolicibacterium gilvum]